MLLVGCVGDVGSGKTTLLEDLAAWAMARGRRVDGFTAPAGARGVAGRASSGAGASSGTRPPARRGSDRYDSHWLADGVVTPFVVRDAGAGSGGRPPYRVDPGAAARDAAWAARLADGDAPDVVILDEFGPLEAAGGGHAAVWPAVREADPGVVVIAVRPSAVEAVEDALGQRFDVRVDAASPRAAEQLRGVCVAQADWARVGVYGAGAGAIEMTLGSALHAAQVPLSGLVLSSLQAVVLVLAGSGLARRLRVVWVSFIAAGLKALSPAGNRLRPMLAITVQGVLFGGATTALGWNVLGAAVGGWLVGAWAAGQGILLQYLLVGDELLRAYGAAVAWLQRTWGITGPAVGAAIGGWIALNGLIAAAVTVYAWRRRTLPPRVRRIFERGPANLPVGSPRGGWRAAVASGLRDLVRPSFVLPVLLIVIIIVAAGAGWEHAFWIAVRATVVGFVIFSAARAVDPERLVAWLRRHGHWGPAIAFGRALSATRRRPRS